MLTRSVTIVNTLGLHARAAAKFVRVASQFESTVRVARGPRELDGKSILGLLLLGAARGSAIVIKTDGRDEADALEALCRLTADGFDDA